MPSKHSMTTKISDGPFAGWDFTLTHQEHDVDAMEDLYTINVLSPDSDAPAHQFDTYRYSYGWQVINAALTTTDGRVDTRVKAALNWWTEQRTDTPYAIHCILMAIDNTTWASRQEIARELVIDVDGLRPRTAYGKALTLAEQHGLLAWRDMPDDKRYAFLTAAGFELVHPDGPQRGETGWRHLDSAASARSPGRAFPRLSRVSAQTSTAPVPSGPAASGASRRR